MHILWRKEMNEINFLKQLLYHFFISTPVQNTSPRIKFDNVTKPSFLKCIITGIRDDIIRIFLPKYELEPILNKCGSQILLPKGCYKVSKTIEKSNITVKIVGRGAYTQIISCARPVFMFNGGDITMSDFNLFGFTSSATISALKMCYNDTKIIYNTYKMVNLVAKFFKKI